MTRSYYSYLMAPGCAPFYFSKEVTKERTHMNTSLVRLLLASTVTCSLLFPACCCLTPWINNAELLQHTGAKSYRAQGNNKSGDRKMLHRDKESPPRKAQKELSLSCASTRE